MGVFQSRDWALPPSRQPSAEQYSLSFWNGVPRGTARCPAPAGGDPSARGSLAGFPIGVGLPLARRPGCPRGRWTREGGAGRDVTAGGRRGTRTRGVRSVGRVGLPAWRGRRRGRGWRLGPARLFSSSAEGCQGARSLHSLRTQFPQLEGRALYRAPERRK